MQCYGNRNATYIFEKSAIMSHISTGGIHGIKGKEVFYIQGEQQPDIFYISLLQTTSANARVATGERGYMERAMAYPGPLGSNLLLSGSGLS